MFAIQKFLRCLDFGFWISIDVENRYIFSEIFLKNLKFIGNFKQ